MIKKINYKSKIEQNRIEIANMLSGAHTCNRLNTINWIRHELGTEAEILFQYPDYLPSSQKKLYLDYNNIANLSKAWDYILKHPKTKIDNYNIRKIHHILSKNTDIPGGTYRISDAYIEKLQTHAISYEKLLYKMSDIEYMLSNEQINVITRAFNTHFDIIISQPFNDFNKRTARLIMNWLLIQNGYMPILFNKKTDKDNYMNALQARTKNDCKTYSHYLYHCMIRTQNEIIKLLSKSKML